MLGKRKKHQMDYLKYLRHPAMKAVDMVFIFNIQFWVGYVCATLIDRALPPPKDEEIDDRTMLPEIIMQIVVIGYLHTLLAGDSARCRRSPPVSPMMDHHLSNPMWHVLGSEPVCVCITQARGESRKGYEPTMAPTFEKGVLLGLGLSLGSQNLMTRLNRLTRPDVVA